jgi:hypothetical protein
VTRSRLILVAELAAGLAGLAWLLDRFGRGAVTLLRADFSPALLAAFVVAMLVALVASAWRWKLLLDGLGPAPDLGRLFAFRAAAQSVSAVMWGGRLAGEPLRVWYAVRDGVPASAAIATVAIDRTLEMTTGLASVVVFALVLAREVPGIDHTITGALVGAASVALAIAFGLRRLRGPGLVAPLVRRLGNERTSVAAHVATVDAVEEDARRVIAWRGRLLAALAISAFADVLTVVQFALLLAAFGLPSSPVAVVAAIFAAGAGRLLPVPGGVGTVEAAQLWLFGMLGHAPEVGLAVGLATRLRDLVWAAPGFAFLLLRALKPPPIEASSTSTP